MISEAYFNLKVALLKESYGSKVFCIGFNKTGTTSIGKSFELLGYRNSSFNKKVWRVYYAQKEYSKMIKYASKFESFDDLPWLKEDMIPRLDAAFPNSKFVYLKREEEAWKKSLKNWRMKVFKDLPDVDAAWEDYKTHENFVLEYFKNRPSEDFIILDIEDKRGFKKLADFLGKETDLEEFPHFNQT
ncbi:MAG: hypothetical protein MK086_03670 [Flavobacteriales bacterium]|nr:hypothetical protein [Flavobacteriales bacterium]